jgi:hypothetical protein
MSINPVNDFDEGGAPSHPQIRIESTLRIADHKRMSDACLERLCTVREYIREAVLEKLAREKEAAK